MPCQVISAYDNCKQFSKNIEEYLMLADSDEECNDEEITNWILHS
jgi:hypothetical protein